MRDWIVIAGVLAAAALAPGDARAAEPAGDTGRVCGVNATSGKPTGEGLSLAAVARAIQAAHCGAGDALEMTYAEANPAPVVAQFCDLGRQVYVYNAPSSYAQVGVTSELVCSLAGARRTGR